VVAAPARRPDEDFDNAHLMRMAGRFSRRVRGWAAANGVPVIDCKSGKRKHLIAEGYLASHPSRKFCASVSVSSPTPRPLATSQRLSWLINTKWRFLRGP